MLLYKFHLVFKIQESLLNLYITEFSKSLRSESIFQLISLFIKIVKYLNPSKYLEPKLFCVELINLFLFKLFAN